MTRTVRIAVDVEEALVGLARDQKVSVNHLMNDAARRLVEWDAQAEKFGFQEVPSMVNRKMFSYLSENDARELGRWSGDNFARDYIAFWFKILNPETALKALDLLGSRYARTFQLEHETDGGTHTLIIRHEGGSQMSMFYEEFLRTIFNTISGAIISFTGTTENITSAKVELAGEDRERTRLWSDLVHTSSRAHA